jgi:hypothetical protein
MRYPALLIISCLTLFSCEKKDETKSFTGNLPIVSTHTPATANAGQDIVSNVRCELSSLSGSVYFQGFEVKETSPQQFSISAKALYKDWNTQISTPVMWTLDTVATIKTSTPGIYVLRFYNATQLLKADTVQVN